MIKKENTNEHLVPIIPDPEGLLEAMQNTSHTIDDAPLEFIDNSGDARSAKVWVDFKILNNTPVSAIYKDHGTGILNLADTFIIGKRVKTPDQWGLYSMGFITGGLTQGKHIKVWTRHKDGDYQIGVFDVNKMEHVWNAYVRKDLGRDEYNLFVERLGAKYGTIIEITEFHESKWKDVKADEYLENFKRTVSETYGLVIGEDFSIFVNGEEIKPFNPLRLDIPGVQWLVRDHEIEHEGSLFYLDLVHIHPSLKNLVNDHPFDIRNNENAGLWDYRNERLVGRALNFNKLFNKHADGWSQGLRGRLRRSGDSDTLMRANFDKVLRDKDRGICDEELFQKISSVLKHHIKESRERLKEELKKPENIPTNLTIKKFDSFAKKMNMIASHRTDMKPLSVLLIQDDPEKWMVKIDPSGNGEAILFNTNHPFWLDLMIQLPKSNQWKLFEVIVALLIGIRKVDPNMVSSILESLGTDLRKIFAKSKKDGK